MYLLRMVYVDTKTANEPYKYQRVSRIAPIVSKCGHWKGQNVVVMSSVTIGELTIIGANSVVTHSIPSRSIAVGAPATVVKQRDAPQRRRVAGI